MFDSSFRESSGKRYETTLTEILHFSKLLISHVTCQLSVLPQVWSNETMSSKHGPSLSVGQVGCGLSIDGQDEITNAQTSIAADGPTMDYAADQHSQTIFHGAHCHPFEVDYEKLLRTHLDFDLN